MTQRKLTTFVRKNWLPSTIMVVALGAIVWFTASILLQIIYFNDPRHQDQALQRWMTPQYIGLSYDLPRAVVLRPLGLTHEEVRGRTLGEIAHEQGITMDEMTARIRAAAQAHRQASR